MWTVQGRTALVTGATSGIGTEIARGLAAAGAAVVVAARDPARGEATRKALAEETGAEVEVLHVDLASQASIRAATDEFRRRHGRLHVLVNNAGIYTSERCLTGDGVESTLAVNHVAPFLLTTRLLDLLVASAPARVVTVASEAHRLGRVHFDDLQLARRWHGIRAYNQSKLANVLFTRELARRLAGTGVTTNAAHPGIVRTAWGREGRGILQLSVKLATPFMVSAASGARGPLRLATDPALDGVTGRYFASGREATPSRAARDDAGARRLWEASEALVRPGPARV